MIESNNFNDGTTIATVANMDDMIFEGQVDESEVGKIKEGMKLDIRVGKRDGGSKRIAGAKSRKTENSDEESSLLQSFKQQAIEYSNNLFPSRERKDEPPGLFYAIANSVNIFQDRITRSRLAGDPADVLLSPNVARIGMLEFHRADEAIEEGERCVRAAAAQIRRMMGRDEE